MVYKQVACTNDKDVDDNDDDDGGRIWLCMYIFKYIHTQFLHIDNFRMLSLPNNEWRPLFGAPSQLSVLQ